jgi:hypothetical protein
LFFDDALAIQYALKGEHDEAGTTDEYVLEEIAQNLAALGDLEAAKSYTSRVAEMRHASALA